MQPPPLTFDYDFFSTGRGQLAAPVFASKPLCGKRVSYSSAAAGLYLLYSIPTTPHG